MKGISFLRNCGAALVGEYNRVIQFYQLSCKRKLTTVKGLKAEQGLTLETSAFKLFKVANLRFQLS